MATPNFVRGHGGLATSRYDFQSHVDGTAFRHNSNQIDVDPPVDVNGIFYHTVADALAAMSALTSAANTLIFKPNGVANSNIYTSWTALMAARANIEGPATIVVDSTASTKIAVASNGATLPTAVINLDSTAGFLASGSIQVVSDAGTQTVTYTGITVTSFTGCSGGTGNLSTGGVVYQNNGATIDVGTWDLNRNTSIVGNIDGLIESYAVQFTIPDGARLLNSSYFGNMIITSLSNNPNGALDFGAPYAENLIEFRNVVMAISGSGPLIRALGSIITLNGLTFVLFGSLFSGVLVGSLSLYLNDESRIVDNTVNVSGGIANIYTNTPTVLCGTTQPGASISGLGAQNPASDVLGPPGDNYVNSLSGDPTAPADGVKINTYLLQWAATPTGGTPTITQPQAISGPGETIRIQAQAAATASNGNGGSVVILGGEQDGAGARGSVVIGTWDTYNTVTVGATSVQIESGSNFQMTVSSTTITIGQGPSNTSTVFQVGGTTNLTLNSPSPGNSLLQWDASLTGTVIIGQAQSLSAGGAIFEISSQAAATSSNGDGGAIAIISGLGDGVGNAGPVALLTGDGYSGVAGSFIGLQLVAGANAMVQIGPTFGGIQFGQSPAIDLSGGGTITLTPAEYQFPYLVFTGTLPNDTIVVLPANMGSRWFIDPTGVTVTPHNLHLQANSITWSPAIVPTSLFSVIYGGTGKLYGEAIA